MKGPCLHTIKNGMCLERLPDAGDERPLVAALPQGEIPRVVDRLEALFLRLENRHGLQHAVDHDLERRDAIARSLASRQPLDIAFGQTADDHALDLAARIAHQDRIAYALDAPPHM